MKVQKILNILSLVFLTFASSYYLPVLWDAFTLQYQKLVDNPNGYQLLEVWQVRADAFFWSCVAVILLLIASLVFVILMLIQNKTRWKLVGVVAMLCLTVALAFPDTFLSELMLLRYGPFDWNLAALFNYQKNLISAFKYVLYALPMGLTAASLCVGILQSRKVAE